MKKIEDYVREIVMFKPSVDFDEKPVYMGRLDIMVSKVRYGVDYRIEACDDQERQKRLWQSTRAKAMAYLLDKLDIEIKDCELLPMPPGHAQHPPFMD